MFKKLEERHLVCAEVLAEAGRSVRSIAKELGVDESTLRQRLKKRGQVDGRKAKDEACDNYGHLIDGWMEKQSATLESGGRPEAVRVLFDDLVEAGYSSSYKALVRYIRRRQAAPAIRPKRRVEVQPGTRGQIDWTEQELDIADLGGLISLQAFCITLSFSRMWAVVWATNQQMLSWIECHNQAFQRLGGVPATVRHDCTRTAVKKGCGPWAIHNDGYLSYAKQLGFLPDACLA